MKCDKLKAIESATAVIENVHLVYRKSEVDSAIDELKREHHKERHEYIDMVAQLKAKLEVKELEFEKLVKKFVHEASIAESYRSLIYKEDALKYQEVGNSEMYDELSKKSDKAYRHANRWRGIFRKMSQEADK